VIHGENILIADTPEETVESLSAVLTDPAFRSRLVMSAQELVSQSYDWRELGQRLFQIHSTADRAREIKNQ
jgi:glycosyltransferase involved in cell wall biosynthesis